MLFSIIFGVPIGAPFTDRLMTNPIYTIKLVFKQNSKHALLYLKLKVRRNKQYNHITEILIFTLLYSYWLIILYRSSNVWQLMLQMVSLNEVLLADGNRN